MADDGQRGQDPPEPTADECVRAGMYWFGRSDFQAAQAWWERAVELDPRNTRAQECLRLLNKTSSTGFKGDEVNPFEAPNSTARPTTQTAAPARPDESGFGRGSSGFTPGPSGSGFSPAPSGSGGGSWSSNYTGDLGMPPSGAAGPPDEQPPVILGPGSTAAHTPPDQDRPPPREHTPVPTDPFDFAAHGQHHKHGKAHRPPPVKGSQTPWDEGPSRTSVVTIKEESGGFDAVPEPTPLPEIDRERFFGRGDPQSTDEIVSFLRATGDLPEPEDEPVPVARSERPPSSGDLITPSRPVPPAPPPPPSEGAPRPPDSGALSGEIVFDDPVEMGAQAAAPGPSPETLLKEARDRFGLHDFDGVLERVEQLPQPMQSSEEVRNLVAEARRNLLRMYESKIGDFEHIPRVVISEEEVIWLNLNHRAGFILSQIDGTVSYEDLVALSGMPRLDTVRILADLLDKKVVA